MNLSEKKEQIVISYSRTFDKEMAYIKIGLTPEEKDELDNDVEFQQRLELFLIEEREEIIQNLRDFMNSDNEKISFQATIDLGRILYKDFFEGLTPPTTVVNVNNNEEKKNKAEEKRIAEEYGHILNNEKKFIDNNDEE